MSEPPYHSLNLAFHVGDDPAAVRRNREQLGLALGLDATRFISPVQRHSGEVALIFDENPRSGGTESGDSSLDPCDGLASTLKDVPLLLHFADCVPVVLLGAAADGSSAVAVLHAGREGLIAGVLDSGVRSMSENFGIEAGLLRAAIGPAIGRCCYQVGDDIALQFERRFGTSTVHRDRDGSRLDLRQAVTATLMNAGLDPGAIHSLSICTCCDPDFFSFRRDGITGRHGALAWIAGGAVSHG